MEDSYIYIYIHKYIRIYIYIYTFIIYIYKRPTISFRSFSLEPRKVPVWNKAALAPCRFGSACRLPEDLLSEALLQRRPFHNFRGADGESFSVLGRCETNMGWLKLKRFDMTDMTDMFLGLRCRVFCFLKPRTWEFPSPFFTRS